MERWMKLALEEAHKAAQEQEVPVGAVAVLDGELVAQEHNRSIQLHDPTGHAEILVLRQAGQKLSNYRLKNLEIYVTLEPCAMCAGALLWARIQQLVFGSRDEKAGAVFS
jgi:tRNA(adenine34) deaminase